MFMPAAQGFGRVASSLGLNALGGAPGRDFERKLGFGREAITAFSTIKGAQARAKAVEYAGRQRRNAAIFGGVMDGLGGLAKGYGGGAGGAAGGGNMSDFNSSGLFTNPPEMRFDRIYQGSFSDPKYIPGGYGGF